MKLDNIITTNDLSAQLHGLTDAHIYYLEQDNARPIGIHHLMLADFQALVTSAAKANLRIEIASGYRSFERQLLIWNNKFSGKTVIKKMNGKQMDITTLNEDEIIESILLFSALPGASRHHWGCDIDIYAPNLLIDKSLQLEPWEYSKSGPMAKLSTWLKDNAMKFGFYFPYDNYRGGIAAEPWHLSYAPLAKQYQSALNVDELRACLIQADIDGKAAIIENLPKIYKRFISNINTNYPLIK